MSAEEDPAYSPGLTSRDGYPARLNPDAKSLRALAHPIRLQILDILQLEGPATATALADRLGVLPGSTSWHLSKLAEHGYIEEVPELGNRRDRWWRSIKMLLQYAEAMDAGPDQARATTEFMITGLGHDLALTVNFLRQEWDFEWRHAAIFNNSDQLFLDPPTLEQLRSELWDLLSRYTQNPSTTPQARRVIFTMQAYPYRPDDPTDD
jgi:DNA-binding transcriptional ArsR family regulator